MNHTLFSNERKVFYNKYDNNLVISWLDLAGFKYSNSFSQNTPLSKWKIIHNLNSVKLSINVFVNTTTGLQKVSPSIIFTNNNELLVDFNGISTTGIATILNFPNSVLLVPPLPPSVSNSPTPSPTITPTITHTTSLTPPVTPTLSLTVSPSITPTISTSITITPSMSQTLTPSNTPNPSPTPSITVSLSPTITPTITISISLSITPSITPTISITPSLTPSISVS